jgi:hypothetical protein
MSRCTYCAALIAATSSAVSLHAPAARAEDRPAAGAATGQSVLTKPLRLTLGSDRPETRIVKFELLGSGIGRGYYAITPVCTAPCAADVAPESPYRIVGAGMTPSPVFRLAPGHDVDVDVRGGSWRAHAAGTVLSLLGAVYVPVGAAMIGAQEAFGDENSRALLPVGATFIAVGLTVLMVGLPLWLGSRTHLSIRAAAAPAGSVAF